MSESEVSKDYDPTVRDGRRMVLGCRCDDEDLLPEADPVSDSLWIACRGCGRDIAVADISEVRGDLRIAIESLDDLDPQIRDMLDLDKVRE